MVEFLRKFENRGFKFAWVNSILIAKSIQEFITTIGELIVRVVQTIF